jgi:DNA-binding transcriptional regulator YiaG
MKNPFQTEYLALYSAIGCKGLKLAEWLNTTPETISRWRCGARAVPGPAITAMRALASGWRP